jgi:hypothetical protein
MTRRGNNTKSKIRSRVEHVFAEQKDRGLFIRTIGIAWATTKIGAANLTYNIKRFIFLRKIAVAWRAPVAQGAPFDKSPIQIGRKSDASHLKRTVMPTRRPNVELRKREHLTEAEVQRLMEGAKGNRPYRHGLPNWWTSDGIRSTSERAPCTSAGSRRELLATFRRKIDGFVDFDRWRDAKRSP